MINKMSSNIEDIYQALLKAGITEDDIDRQVEEKYNEFQGFMSKQAILFLIAKKQGLDIASSDIGEPIHYEIDYNDFAIPISEVTETMNNIVITGRILRVFNMHNFVRKDGSHGKVGSFIIGDKSGTIKVVLWNDQAKIMERDFFKAGEIIQVVGEYSKIGLNDEIEVHLSKAGKIILSPKDVNLPLIPVMESFQDSNRTQSLRKDSGLSIKDLYEKEGFIKSITGIIKVEEFKELIKKDGEKTFLLKLLLTDDISSIRVLLWGVNAVETLKIVSDGDSVHLSNVAIRKNAYTSEKELIFTSKSGLEIN